MKGKRLKSSHSSLSLSLLLWNKKVDEENLMEHRSLSCAHLSPMNRALLNFGNLSIFVVVSQRGEREEIKIMTRMRKINFQQKTGKKI
jgi:hypothetical protein